MREVKKRSQGDSERFEMKRSIRYLHQQNVHRAWIIIYIGVVVTAMLHEVTKK